MSKSQPKQNNLTQRGLVLAYYFNMNHKIVLQLLVNMSNGNFSTGERCFFANESQFFLTRDGCITVYKSLSEPFSEGTIQKIDIFEVGLVMVWYRRQHRLCPLFPKV